MTEAKVAVMWFEEGGTTSQGMQIAPRSVKGKEIIVH
jgi:hypothetical protein